MASERIISFALFVFLYSSFTYVAAQESVEALDGEEGVSLRFTIPVVPSDVPLISIKYNGNKYVAYFYPQTFDVTIVEVYKARLSSKTDESNRQVIFTFNSVTSEDAGSYECFQGTTNQNYENCGVNLIIIRKPDPPIIELAANSSKVVGQDLILSCQTKSRSLPENHGLPSLVKWWIDPDLRKGDNIDRITENGDTLVLSNMQKEDKDKKIRCRSADNPRDKSKQLMSEYSSDFVVTPEFGPSTDDIVITPHIPFGNTFSVNQASSENFYCNVTCEPQCGVVWQFKAYAKESFAPAPKGYSRGGNLSLDTVRRSSHGEYRCVGTNEHGSVDHSFYLNILYMLTPIPYINDVQTDMGNTLEGDGDVVLKCEFDSNPMPSVSWHAPDNRLLLSGVLEGPKMITSDNNLLTHRYTSETILLDLKCSDIGQYQCRSYTEEIGSMYQNITVEVKCKPRPVLDGPKHLKKDYVWEIPYDLYVEFLVEAWPKPTLRRVESEKDGNLQGETSAVDVVLQESYDRKPYLTLVKLHSRRELTLEDDGRTFIITLANSDFQVPFRFTIQARGRPHPVSNITVDKISHNSVHLSWLPGFNGGDAQTFSVMMQNGGQAQTAPDKGTWVMVVSDIPDSSSSGQRVRAKVDGMAPSTEYTLWIMGVTDMGNSTQEIIIKTLSAPASSMAAGAIVGIVFAIIIIILIITAVLFYVFVYRKRWSKDSTLPSKVRAVYRHFKGHQNGSADGAKVAPKERRPIFLGKSKEAKGKDYPNVPTESTDPTMLEDVYANADEIKSPMLSEPIYSNTSPGTDTFQESEEGRGDEGRSTSEEGLLYTTLDFSGDGAQKGGKKGKKPKKAKKPEKKEKKEKKEEEETVTYSDINFDQTKAKELELKRGEEEREPAKAREEENPYQAVSDVPGTTV